MERKVKLMKKITKNIHIIILLLSILSIITYKHTNISISLSIISFILSIFFSKRNRIILILTLSISSILTTINLIKIYNNNKNNQDIYENQNLLLGTWIYNEYNGKYIFSEDYKYTQYSNEETTDNYCIGTYEYNYGASKDYGVLLTQDNNYYYYTLILKEDYCIIMNKEFNDNYTKTIYFALDKTNKEQNELIFINKETENMFTLNKID